VDPEFWLPVGFIGMGELEAHVRAVESDGWDGYNVCDTQCLLPDPFVAMTLGVLSTTTLRFSIATSNPATRHPSVAAAAISSVAELAPGRVLFGVGRGDSALAHVGGAPAPVGLFERYVAAVRKYLHGEDVPFGEVREWLLTADVESIELGHAPDASRLNWPTASVPTVPIEVYATGPRVLAAGARHADKVTFGVGADPQRVRWAIETIRDARNEAGLDPDAVTIGAIVCIAPFDDLARARRSVGNIVAATARFAVMSGAIAGPVSDPQREVYRRIASSYDMNHHGGFGDQVGALTDEFLDEFAIVGPPEQCAERMLELHELGVDAFQVAPPLGDANDDDRTDGYRNFVDAVIPKLKS